MSWVATQISLDEEEEFDRTLSFVEYLASFINFEAVKKTKEQRENRKTMSDEEFQELIKQISGRDAPKFQKRK